jgi:16S rRNA processing protein RimM
MNAPGRLLAGEVGKPFGLAGDVYVVRISDDPGRFDPGAILFDASGGRLVVENSRAHGNRLLIKFAGVDDRDTAEKLRGPVFVSATDLRELEDDEFWPHELLGCTVYLQSGEEVGTVEEIVPGSAHDLLEISTATGERLVPVVKQIVVAVDVDARRVTIDPPDGLLD